ncbi:stationary phase survival protein SurE [Actibacterium mucosum KCTC 23349]|uniref:5'-nucleotidase SurE n=1 Tax=Actibacterium mucosum KCTC 23349 TaxID=1454373 RepID=A0A037ZGF1_9RHOB|nr:5'/3'-nucleotidase SurE [Actibacterium mucosum]KAJ55525.1 stationary phase survival protein SurE [Actibacterium mucosum KCTC 23349]
MRILITNDDGINAPGLKVLHAIATEIAGPKGEVWTVAPAFEQSGVGHKISYTHPTMLAELGPRRFAAEGAPADCVLAGLHEVMKDAPPELVLSGVNRGNNAGENVLYSGTLGGAMEAALQGLPAIALSQYIGPDNRSADAMFHIARTEGAATVRKLVDRGLWTQDDYRLFYNVNFPPIGSGASKGLMVAHQGYRRDARYTTQAQTSPTGRRFLWVTGGGQQTPAGPGSDVTVCLDGHIAVTPLRADLTAHDTLTALAERLE